MFAKKHTSLIFDSLPNFTVVISSKPPRQEPIGRKKRKQFLRRETQHNSNNRMTTNIIIVSITFLKAPSLFKTFLFPLPLPFFMSVEGTNIPLLR
jgi:hypothetical protein